MEYQNLKVLVADFSLFTLPYDHYFCSCLSNFVKEVILVGRPLRKGEKLTSFKGGSYKFYPIFYKKSEKIIGKKNVLKLIKGFEHLINCNAFLNLLKKENPDIIHFQWFVLPVVDAFFLYKISKKFPLILTLHNKNIFHGSPTNSLQSLNWKRIIKYFDLIFVHTFENREHLIKIGIKPERISIIHHPLFEIKPLKIKKGENKLTLMIFGQIKPYKGVDLAIKAVAELPPEIKGKIKLKIVGEPFMDVSELKELSIALKVQSLVEWDFRFIPEEELPSILSEADCFLLPYREIDASGVFATVVNFEKPVIASRIGVFKEIIEKYKIGLLFQPEDVKSLRDKIREFYYSREKLEKQVKENIKRVKNDIGKWEEIAQKVLKEYSRLIKLKKFYG